MALFGSTWNEDSKEIGPFSHWLEDWEDTCIGSPIHNEENEEDNRSIGRPIHDD